MILLLDAGNSRIKWRVQQAGEVLASGAMPTHSESALDQTLHAALTALSFQHAVVCSVAGAGVDAVVEAAIKASIKGVVKDVIKDAMNAALHAGNHSTVPQVQGGPSVNWLKPAANAYGLTNLYQPPESLGADRYAALIAAHHRCLGACVVVNVGTAMTVDMLTNEGHFLGGFIVLGPDLMRASLHGGTAGVKAAITASAPAPAAHSCAAEWPTTPEPTTTAIAVAQGIGYALSGGVMEACRRIQVAVGETPTVVLSGGARAALRPYLSGTVIETDELVLEGLAWVARDLGYNA